MATFASLAIEVLRSVEDAGGIFHTTARVTEYLRAGESLLSMARGLVEKTGSLPLDGSYAYRIHDVFPDFIRPLRVSANGIVLVPTSLENVSLLDPFWNSVQDTPERWFMWGGTWLSIVPLAGATTATVTYLAVPSATVTTPTVQTQWHRTLTLFAQAICLAKEAQYGIAGEKLKEFLAEAGIKDTRVLATSAQRPRKETDMPIKQAQD